MSERDKETISLIRPERPVVSRWKRLEITFKKLLSQFSRNPLDRCRWIRIPSTLKSTSSKPKDQLARAGEDEAAWVLQEKGYEILHRNIRFPEGELDIIARHRDRLVFVEVKTRRSHRFGSPSEAVSPAKQRRQIASAQRFLDLCGLKHVPTRFDVMAILWPENAPPTFEHFEDAFRPQDVAKWR